MIPKDYQEFLQGAMFDLYDSAMELSKAKNLTFGESVEFIKTAALISISVLIADFDTNFNALIASSGDKEGS